MLAQNFKTAADLGISEAEVGALIKVLGMLERDEVRHVEVDDFDRIPSDPQPSALFNMGDIFVTVDCGTAACIAGTSDLFCGTEFISAFLGDFALRRKLPPALKGLFCPPIDEDEWTKITVEQAARALRSYLTAGEPNWFEALASQP